MQIFPPRLTVRYGLPPIGGMEQRVAVILPNELEGKEAAVKIGIQTKAGRGVCGGDGWFYYTSGLGKTEGKYYAHTDVVILEELSVNWFDRSVTAQPGTNRYFRTDWRCAGQRPAEAVLGRGGSRIETSFQVKDQRLTTSSGRAAKIWHTWLERRKLILKGNEAGKLAVNSSSRPLSFLTGIEEAGSL